MPWLHWLTEYALPLLESAGIIGSLLFTGYQLRLDVRTRRVENRFTITRHHRDLWRLLDSHPELERIKQPDVDLQQNPVTPAERRFVTQLLLHFKSSLYAAHQGVAPVPDGLREDMEQFLRLPIPESVWQSTAPYLYDEIDSLLMRAPKAPRKPRRS